MRKGGIAAVIGYPILALAAFLCVASALDRMTPMSPAAPSFLATFDFGEGAARNLAMGALSRGDFTAASALAMQSLSQGPARQGNISLLGAAQLGAGSKERARKTFLVATHLGWRDPITQHYWLNEAISTGDVAGAAARIDALLRVGSASQKTSDTLLALDESPEGRAAIAARLANNPAWARDYVDDLNAFDAPEEIADRASVLQKARAGGLQPDCTTLARVARGLITRNMVNEAAGLWFSVCQPGQAARNVIFDGGFEADGNSAESPFSWQLINSGDSDVRIVEGADRQHGKALYVESTSATNETAARQFALLGAGRYRLSWAATGTDPLTSMSIAVKCRNAADNLPQTDTKALGNDRFGSEFSIPTESCNGQWIAALTRPKASGGPVSLYIDDIKVEAIHVAE